MFSTVQQVAEKLNVSQSCVYQLIESGKLPHHRIGVGRGTIRISKSDLEAYLTAHHQVPQQPEKSRPKRARLKHLKL